MEQAKVGVVAEVAVTVAMGATVEIPWRHGQSFLVLLLEVSLSTSIL